MAGCQLPVMADIPASCRMKSNLNSNSIDAMSAASHRAIFHPLPERYQTTFQKFQALRMQLLYSIFYLPKRNEGDYLISKPLLFQKNTLARFFYIFPNF
jgi:hypothetical protein